MEVAKCHPKIKYRLMLIRGRTVNLIVDNELIYVEPIFIRSRQNPVPQLQRVVVVVRGKAYMGAARQSG